jgi:hypothetical protein
MNVEEKIPEPSTDHVTIIELTAAEVLAVAGGLNPQPLPPRVEEI